jgi:hypothetical protein
MFGLFSTPREKALKKANAFFNNQFSELCRWDDATIGQVLDIAAKIKLHSMSIDSSKEAERVYTNPCSVPEATCLAQLEIFDAIMVGWVQDAITEARQVEGVSPWQSRARDQMHIKRAGLSIWHFSLVAGCFEEFRENGRVLWNQLKRGYPHCKIFVPEKDTIKFLAKST